LPRGGWRRTPQAREGAQRMPRTLEPYNMKQQENEQ
jgi:hypothetical protein